MQVSPITAITVTDYRTDYAPTDYAPIAADYPDHPRECRSHSDRRRRVIAELERRGRIVAL
jgi:hypothetical protein